MMKTKRKILSICIICLIIILVPLGIFVGNSIYQKMPHHITDVEELKYLISDFEDLSIESCDIIWKSDVMFMGGSLESRAVGKIVVSEQYYNDIRSTYNWAASDEKPDLIKDDKLDSTLSELLSNNKYLVSDEYQNMFSPSMFLSENENELYFYYHFY